MSRILRRPMFRGGRVDSRGTGIASGLSYNKGGTVQPRQNFIWGGVATGVGQGLLKYGWRPALKYGRKGMDWLLAPKGGFPMKISGGAGGTMDKYIKHTMPPRTWGEYGKELGTSRVAQYLGQSPTLQLLGWGAKKSPGLAKKVTSPEGLAALYFGGPYLKEKYDEMFPGEKADGREFVGEEAEIVGDPRDLPTEQETLEQIIAKIKAEEEAKREELIAALTPKKLTEDEKLAEIEKKKKMFEKVYGSGKGEDISNMLFGFAGEALKPGADTKTAFGEFFEKEAKRPSSSKKYKDAAAQAAIQSFLTGETSYQKFQDDLLAYSNKLGIQTASAKAAEKDKSLAKIKGESRETSNTKKNLNSAQTWLDNQGIDKYVNETNSKKVPTEELFVEENIGEYFIDQHTGEFFLITILENGEIGKVRKG